MKHCCALRLDRHTRTRTRFLYCFPQQAEHCYWINIYLLCCFPCEVRLCEAGLVSWMFVLCGLVFVRFCVWVYFLLKFKVCGLLVYGLLVVKVIGLLFNAEGFCLKAAVYQSDDLML